MPQVVKTVTPPAVEPVTLAEAKAHLRVTFTDEDALITALVTAARRLCETAGKIVCVTTTFDVVEDTFPGGSGDITRMLRAYQGGAWGSTHGSNLPQRAAGAVVLPRAPLLGVTSVTYLDASGSSTVLATSEYVVTTGAPGRVAPAFGKAWPVTYPQIGAVTVRITAGYGPLASDVPANVKAAILLVLGGLYYNRESVSQNGAFASMPPGVNVDALLGVETGVGYA